jgi:hypothetical protein
MIFLIGGYGKKLEAPARHEKDLTGFLPLGYGNGRQPSSEGMT